jgi:hypothetical protein
VEIGGWLTLEETRELILECARAHGS